MQFTIKSHQNVHSLFATHKHVNKTHGLQKRLELRTQNLTRKFIAHGLSMQLQQNSREEAHIPWTTHAI